MSTFKNSPERDVEDNSNVDIELLTQDEVNALLDDFLSSMRKCERPLEQLFSGEDYYPAQQTVSFASEQLTGSLLMAFAFKSGWVDDEEAKNKFLLNTGTKMTFDQKSAAIELCKTIKSTLAFRTELSHLLRDVSEEMLKTSYRVMRFRQLLDKLTSDEEIKGYAGALREFDSIYSRYNKAGIYNDVPVNKSKYTLEENTVIVKEYMNDDIQSTKYLKKFVEYPGKYVPAEITHAYNIDIMTSNFREFIDNYSKLTAFIDKSNDLIARAPKSENKSLASYTSSFENVLFRLQDVLRHTRDIIDDFKSSSMFPFSVLKYDVDVETIASKHFLGSTDTPANAGTNYSEIFKNMVKSLGNLAVNVAKSANDHYGA